MFRIFKFLGRSKKRKLHHVWMKMLILCWSASPKCKPFLKWMTFWNHPQWRDTWSKNDIKPSWLQRESEKLPSRLLPNFFRDNASKTESFFRFRSRTIDYFFVRNSRIWLIPFCDNFLRSEANYGWGSSLLIL